MSGSTAVVCLLDGNELVVGNLGDSRCVVGGIQDNETTAQVRMHLSRSTHRGRGHGCH